MLKDIIKQNDKRKLTFRSKYDPLTGEGSLVPRFRFRGIFLPEQVRNHELIRLLKIVPDDVVDDDISDAINQLRLETDFEYWAYTTIKIIDKKTGKLIRFKLNEPQRKYVARLEFMRVAGIPIRVIVLKGRQWGGSTLTQIYAFWIQNILHTYWNSAIVGDVESQARNVRSMYTKASNNYPAKIGTITLKPFEGSSKNKFIEESGSVISIGSMQKPESLRSDDLKIVHLSEVGLWKSTESKSPEDLVQSITGSVPHIADTMIVMESTAKGVGNYFHVMYNESKAGKTGYETIFVSWFEFKDNTIPIKESTLLDFYNSLSSYEKFLWKSGACLEGIKWYRVKLRAMKNNTWRMRSEFPTNEIEAFQSTGNRVFPIEYVSNARRHCDTPVWIGDFKGDGNHDYTSLDNIEWHNNDMGSTKVWSMPETGYLNRYVCIVDIGGTTPDSDWSVIRVLDRKYVSEGGKLESVMTCNLHLDVDIVIWRATAIAKIYDNALLVIEKNSLNRKKDAGENYLTVLSEIADVYPNLYKRAGKEDEEIDGREVKYGFHTNKSTKPMIVKLFKAILREDSYIERDSQVLDEADIYEEKKDGSYGNVDGKGNHDDKLMTTMIGCYISNRIMEPCKLKNKTFKRKHTKIQLSKF